jgi:alanyl-tRNA synthetase
MKTNELREKYLDFYQGKGHTICPSDVLVPKWDNTVLFTPAGMNPFKDHFLGKVELEFTRATSCQKCLRTGDIENVGRTAYHHTFFEMLGNFSFGDYFKRDAISWAWEFLTDKKWLGISPDRLTVTVYLDDDEASDIWHKDIGLSTDRITRLGEDDNFWPASAPSQGPDGVCGPCSEIFFHPDNGPECEIWNLVFTQFNRSGDPPENLSPLPSKNIDTGMGLERIVSMLQGKKTNYHIDSLLPLVEASAEVCGRKYDADGEDGRRIRRIADHIRACTMAIHENVYPGPQKEEYVIRRLLRRAVLQGHEMGMREPFLYQLVPAVVDAMSEPYPEIKNTADRVAEIVKYDESNFFSTLDDGLERMDTIFTKLKSSGAKVVPGDKAAKLYQERGIPGELFESIASDHGFTFDWDAFKAAMVKHGEDSGAGQVGVMGDTGPVDDIKREVKLTEFLGYDCDEESGTVVGLISVVRQAKPDTGDSNSTEEQFELIQTRESELEPNDEQEQVLVLDRTPFYAESGGQVADCGMVEGPNGKFEVTDVQKNGDVFVHFGKVVDGMIRNGETVQAKVDTNTRKGIQRAHSATHILHYGLQKFVGENALQRGSKVECDQLRFDFSNLEGLSDETLMQIESEANRRVVAASKIKAEILPLEEARAQGAMMLFGEKYPDPVRMVSIGDFSKELCGGIHLDNTSDIGAFEIIAEDNVASGTRRIVALTGERAKANQAQVQEMANEVSELLGVSVAGVRDAAINLSEKVKSLRKQVSTGKVGKPKEVSVKAASDGELDYFGVRQAMRDAAMALEIPLLEVGNRVRGLLADVDEFQAKIKEMDSAEKVDAETLINGATQVGDVHVIVQHLHSSNPNIMRTLIDQVRKKTSPTAVFLATALGAEKVILVAGVSRDLVDKGLSAGEWVNHVAPIVGGGGGGRPDLAQAGGKNPEKIKEALIAASEFMNAKAAV